MLLDLDDDRRAFRDAVRSWVDKNFPPERSLELEKLEYQYPYELWDAMTDAGFHAVGIAEEYGGQGGDAVDTAVLARELARSLGGLSWVWGIPSFAGAKALGHGGTPDQKREYLPRLAAGQIRFAIAVTEPGGGTDLLGAMTTRARKVAGGWRISGQKMWSTGAKEADYLLLLARSDDPSTGNADRRPATTLLLVPTDSAGIEMQYIAADPDEPAKDGQGASVLVDMTVDVEGETFAGRARARDILPCCVSAYIDAISNAQAVRDLRISNANKVEAA